MFLAQLQLGGILNGDDAFVVGDEAGKNVQQRRFAATGAAGDDDVEPRFYGSSHEGEHVRRDGAQPAVLLVGDPVPAELADGDRWAVQRQRRDDGVDAGTGSRSIDQATIDIGRGLVAAPANGRDDAVDHAQHVVVVLEGDVRFQQFAGALNPDAVWAVDHDFTDRRVGQERLYWPEA